MTPADDVSAALERTVAVYGALVRRVGWRHRLGDAEVDELLQEVRLRLWRARGDGEQIAAVTSSYVYRTAVSAALDLLRRRRSRPADSLDDLPPAAEPPTHAATSDPTAALAESELAAAVMHVVDGIAPARRPVVRMYLAGYPRDEIAELLGWTEAKTRNLLYRGLADVREGLLARGIGRETAEARAAE